MKTYNNSTPATNANTAPQTAERPSGRAVRFLRTQRLGRLITTDPVTGEPHVSPVHYVTDEQGGFVTLLPNDSLQLAAIREGGRSVLSVQSTHDVDAAWHVQAVVEIRLTRDTETVRDILRRQIHAVLRDLPQEDKSDPLPRAGQSEVEELVGLRMRLIDVVLRERTHPPLAEAIAG